MDNSSALSDHESAIDAVLRFVESLDDDNAFLVHFTVTSDTIIDLSPISDINHSFSELIGREPLSPSTEERWPVR